MTGSDISKQRALLEERKSQLTSEQRAQLEQRLRGKVVAQAHVAKVERRTQQASRCTLCWPSSDYGSWPSCILIIQVIIARVLSI